MIDVTAGQESIVTASDAVLSELFATYADRLTRFVYTRLDRPDWHLAEDIVGDTFLGLVRTYAGKELDLTRSFGLLAAIARHAMGAHYDLKRSGETPADFAEWAQERHLPAAPAAEASVVVRLEARELLADRPEVLTPAARRQADALADLAVAA